MLLQCVMFTMHLCILPLTENDKDDVLLEEAKDDPSPKKRLFDFLSKIGKEDYIDNVYPMFNVPFVLKEMLMSLF